MHLIYFFASFQKAYVLITTVSVTCCDQCVFSAAKACQTDIKDKGIPFFNAVGFIVGPTA